MDREFFTKVTLVTICVCLGSFFISKSINECKKTNLLVEQFRLEKLSWDEGKSFRLGKSEAELNRLHLNIFHENKMKETRIEAEILRNKMLDLQYTLLLEESLNRVDKGLKLQSDQMALLNNEATTKLW